MHVSKTGQGSDLVMLHGWSMHSGVFASLIDTLSSRFTVHAVDLPGHGQSRWQAGALDCEPLLTTLADKLPERATWLGWSLGGQFSIAFADRYPERVSKLILIAANPSFIQRDNWPGVEPAVLRDFAERCARQPQQTLQRFLMLQMQGSDNPREIKRRVLALLGDSVPDPTALSAGLQQLMTLDLRQAMSQLPMPVNLILGTQDALVPESLAERVRQLNSDIEVDIISDAGHVPFISHPQITQDLIEAALNVD